MRNNFYRLFNLFIIVTVLFLGCGKKTDPISKSVFKIEPPSKDAVKLVDNGFKIVNSSKDYILEVYKKADESCTKYNLIAKVEPRKSIIDEDVKSGQRVIYKLVRKHPEYRVYSEPVYIEKVFAKKAFVKVDRIVKYGDIFEIRLNFSKNTKFVLYGFEKSSLDKISTKPLIKVKTDKPMKIFILPYNDYNFEGDLISVEIIPAYFEKLNPVKNIKVIKRKDGYLISWESDAPKTKIIDEDTGKVILLTDTNFVEVERCSKYILIATNGVVDSDGVTVNPCD
ncbi:hypothetical protein FHQ18_03665 [Deferribacter autotrophicus]|uniref:Uncharacterized protein n=1 Tax=Deferribacter autotrophicus TaxID=500465 RepID=A0A5A8F5T5_9BACT|nr:hypothetical protein [Deferribacter autotrophicus]KAA0259060.1 hypothetical protein FHQ18_03665 [Deferribacter autotrophicus]